ncbi:MAG TPA: hypothetical protein VIH21_04175 [Dehalococcoidia bacterium]
MSSLATIRADVRKDLHDEDSAAYRWTDSVLDRHIKRSVREYSFYNPLEQKSALVTLSNSRDVDVSMLTPRVRIVAAEYPTGRYPPSFTPFGLWGETLTLDLQGAPSGTPAVNVFWHKVHAINGSVTFPATDDDIIATGAAGFAALELASFASNRVNVGGDNVWGRYLDFGQQRLKDFYDQLRRMPAANKLRSGRFYSPVDVRLTSQTSDPGPV